MQAAKLKCWWLPKAPFNTVCKTRPSCKQAQARHTSMRLAAIQSWFSRRPGAKARQPGFWTSAEHEAARRRQRRLTTCVAIGSRRRTRLPGASCHRSTPSQPYRVDLARNVRGHRTFWRLQLGQTSARGRLKAPKGAAPPEVHLRDRPPCR